MMIVPAAMFAMFYFLSQFIQNVMGYSPLKTGVRVPAVLVRHRRLGATIGLQADRTGSTRAGSPASARCWRGSRCSGSRGCPYDVDRRRRSFGARVNYATDILPFIVLMALRHGPDFVPLTLTAVHRLRPEDSGIGSGVLNTMQQVGGALGLATLSTVAVHSITADRGGARRRRRARRHPTTWTPEQLLVRAADLRRRGDRTPSWSALP